MPTLEIDVRLISEISDVPESPKAGSHTAFRVFGQGTPNDGLFVKQLPIHELARELVCALIAMSAGLPTPRPYLVDLRSLRLTGERWAYGTEFLRGARAIGQDEAIIQRLIRWPLLPLAIAFDELIANNDRTLKNLLYRTDQPSAPFVLIDHGEALPPGLLPSHAYGRNLLAERLPANQGTRSSRSQRVLTEAEKLQFDSSQIVVASKAEAWGGEQMVRECLRLLEDRRQFLQVLIASRFDNQQRPIQWL